MKNMQFFFILPRFLVEICKVRFFFFASFRSRCFSYMEIEKIIAPPSLELNGLLIDDEEVIILKTLQKKKEKRF